MRDHISLTAPLDPKRRDFLAAAMALGGSSFILTDHGNVHASEKKEKEKEGKDEGEDISATEDLMREHGILNRVLLIYEEGVRRLLHKEEVTPDVFQSTASLVRKFVEDYHEKLEENFIFPEFEKQKALPELVATLRTQHNAGRRATDTILQHSTPDHFTKADSREALIHACQGFVRMYRPHEAREDTVLFPTLHKIISKKQLDELGEKFEAEEHRLFGDEGFEKNVDLVATVERQLGIYDLARFTVK